MGSREEKTAAEEAGAVCPQGLRAVVGGCSARRGAEGKGGWGAGLGVWHSAGTGPREGQGWFLHEFFFFFYCGKIDVTWFPIIIKFIYIVVQPSLLPVSGTPAWSHADTVTFTHLTPCSPPTSSCLYELTFVNVCECSHTLFLLLFLAGFT